MVNGFNGERIKDEARDRAGRSKNKTLKKDQGTKKVC